MDVKCKSQNSHTTMQHSSNFQRSQSKVWWSDFETIQERKTTTNFTLLRQGSPSSHKSQDSGFSDTEISPPSYYINNHTKSKIETINESINLLNSENKSPDKLTPKKILLNNEDNLSHSQRLTPSSVCDTPVTPPTVIRRPDSHNINRENCVSRRISFNETPDDENNFNQQIDSLNYSSISPIDNNNNNDSQLLCNSSHDDNNIRNENKLNESQNATQCKCDKDRSIKRGRTISRSSSKFNNRNVPEIRRKSNIENNVTSDDDSDNEHNNTNNDHGNFQPKKSILKKTNQVTDSNVTICSLDETLDEQPFRTSTPKPYDIEKEQEEIPKCVQKWLMELRNSYHHEVLSTLQTKSIAVEAGRNLKVTASIAAKLIRNTQTRVMTLQQDFEKLEKMLQSNIEIFEISTVLQILASSLIDFMEKQKLRSQIYCEDGHELKRFNENICNVIEMSIDLRCAAVKFDEFDIDLIREDVIVLKRYVLITVRQIFEKLIKIIINSIEDNQCEMILRSSLSTLSMLSNIEYSGFASLNSAFLANETVKILLIQILDSKQSSIRALALRSLATVCSTQEAIKQFEQCGGLEILKEIMTDQKEIRCEPELRETVSVLTQLTAPWHGDDHKVKGLKDCVECFVEAITDLLSTTNCCQTLLLCAACLNNFSKVEPTSIYSLMSHETVCKLNTAVDNRGPGASIFLFEQITSMLLNMASNKKCHNHLSNKVIINFITKIFQHKFYEKYQSVSESVSQKKTIKNILYIISHLIHESIINPEILENDVLPIFQKIEIQQKYSDHYSPGDTNQMYSSDIQFLNKKLNESLTYKHNHVMVYKSNSGSNVNNLISSHSHIDTNNIITVTNISNDNHLTITKKRYESFV